MPKHLKPKLAAISAALCFFNLVSANSFKVNISGEDSTLNSNVQQNLAADLTQDQSMTINDYQQLVIEQAKSTLAIYGYYDPIIKPSIKDQQINLEIIPGKPVLLTNIEIKPVDKLSEGVIHTYSQQLNKPFNQVSYEELKTNLLQNAQKNGYLDAEFTTHKVAIDKQHHTVKVELHLTKNKLYSINTIKINAAATKDLSSDFVFSFLPSSYHINPASNKVKQINLLNTAYNSQDILDLQNNLSKYYNNVDIKTKINKAQRTVNLIIDAKPLKNYYYNTGLGYGTDEGARVFGGLQIRNLNDHGHKLDLQGKIAQYRDFFAVNYIIPGFFPATDLATVGYQFKLDQKRNDAHLQKERQQVLSQYQRILDNGNLQYTGGLSYRQEHYKDIIHKTKQNSELFVPYVIYDQVLLAPGSTRIKTNTGLNLNVMLEGADKSLLSNTSFIRLSTKLKAIYPLSFYDSIDGLRLITKGQFGQVWHTKDHKIPPTLRFFAGGSESVRGYAFESLAPTAIDEHGKKVIIGGDRLLSFGAELEKTVYKSWSVATFYDMGNSMDTWDKWRDNLFAGVGAGVRWQSPLGPVRLDIANGINSKSRHKPWRFDINIGADL